MHGEKQSLSESAESIMKSVIGSIDARYGVAYGQFQAGATPLAYHNGFHTRNVVGDFEQLAPAADLTDDETLIGRLASSSHDMVQGQGIGINETASGIWLVTELETKTTCPESLRTMAGLAVFGTEPVFEGPLMVDQVANRQDYPSKRHELVAKAVASADMGRIYTPIGPYVGHLLHHEIVGSQADEITVYDRLLDFQRNQPEFLDTYVFPLPQADKVLGEHKAKVITYAETLVEMIERGDVENWQQVLDRDLAFRDSLRR